MFISYILLFIAILNLYRKSKYTYFVLLIFFYSTFSFLVLLKDLFPINEINCYCVIFPYLVFLLWHVYARVYVFVGICMSGRHRGAPRGIQVHI